MDAEEALRKVWKFFDWEDGGTRYYRGSIIPSSADIKRVAQIVEWFAKSRVPFKMSVYLAGIGRWWRVAEFDVDKRYHTHLIITSVRSSQDQSRDGVSS
jgi:hypothetical protein